MSARSRNIKVPAAVVAGTSRASAWVTGARFSALTLLTAGLTVMAVLILAPTLKIVFEQRQQVADLQAELERNQATLDALTTEQARWDDPAYIRAQARERLYYVMPGEVNFLVINDANVPSDSTSAPTAALTTTQTNWADAALASLIGAGLSTEPVTPAR